MDDDFGTARSANELQMTSMSGIPLSGYQVLSTSDVSELEQQIISIYGATLLNLPFPKSLKARGYFLKLDDIALGFATSGTLTEVAFAESDYARLQLPLRGHGATKSAKQSSTTNYHRPVLTTPGRSSILQYGDDFEHLFVRLTGRALERKLSALLGAPIRRVPEFDLAEFVSPQSISALRQLVGLVVQQVDNQTALLFAPAMKELEQAVITQVLFASRHSLTELLHRDPIAGSPAHVKRVEEYIEANWSQPITIDVLADVTGIGARSLFRSFEKERGYSPMAFVKKIRLQHARDLLTNPGANTSVTGVAFACGFSNLGYFAQAYRAMFGELPSEALNRRHLRVDRRASP